METTEVTLSDKRKQEIGKVIHKCNAMCDDIYMIFYLPSERGFSSQRYTYNNPDKVLDFLVVTRGEESANDLHTNWLIKEATSTEVLPYNPNLIIISEEEFTTEFGDLDIFKDRVLSGIVVYDNDANFIMELNSLDHPSDIEEFDVSS